MKNEIYETLEKLRAMKQEILNEEELQSQETSLDAVKPSSNKDSSYPSVSSVLRRNSDKAIGVSTLMAEEYSSEK